MWGCISKSVDMCLNGGSLTEAVVEVLLVVEGGGEEREEDEAAAAVARLDEEGGGTRSCEFARGLDPMLDVIGVLAFRLLRQASEREGSQSLAARDKGVQRHGRRGASSSRIRTCSLDPGELKHQVCERDLNE